MPWQQISPVAGITPALRFIDQRDPAFAPSKSGSFDESVPARVTEVRLAEPATERGGDCLSSSLR
jgi:hypothetical protein